jgi:hypothetical protein
MTLTFFASERGRHTDKERYYISQFDGDTYQIIDSIKNREICVCSNYDKWDDAEERAKNIVKLLNKSNKKLLW